MSGGAAHGPWTPVPYGPRWRVEVGVPPAAGADGWIAASSLADPAGEGTARLVEYEYRASGHRTAHAAALTVMAVYAGRVTAAAVLHWALTDRVPDLAADNVLLRPSGHGIADVRVREARLCSPRPGEDSVAALRRTVLEEHLLPIAEALHRRTRAGLRQLRGGVAHGCATALCASDADPGLLERRWETFVSGAPGGLAGLGEVARVRRTADGRERLVYLRRTCCLFHTSAEAVRCASCCLTSRRERLRAYATG